MDIDIINSLENYIDCNMYINDMFKNLDNKEMVYDEVIKYYNLPVCNRSVEKLFMIIPFRDKDKVAYVYANNQFDAVYIYNKMCGCLVPDTTAELILVRNTDRMLFHKDDNFISFEEQCENNDFGYSGENPIVEE